MPRKVLLVCGVLSSLLYVAILVLAPTLWEDYSSTSQTVSELFAIGAPSRPFVVPLLLTYDVLIIAFGLGFWGSSGREHALRVVGGLCLSPTERSAWPDHSFPFTCVRRWQGARER